MKSRLITALRLTAHRIETVPDLYDWGTATQCNCGLLACELLGVTPHELLVARMADRIIGNWQDSCNYGFCKQTGLPVASVLREMVAAGMSKRDILALERCTDQAVLARMGNPVRQYNVASFVALYMRTWADLLTEEGASTIPHVTTSAPLPHEMPHL